MNRQILNIIFDNAKWQTVERSLWIYQSACQCAPLLGDFVEYGCGEGHSASLIRATMEQQGFVEKDLWCYDSFLGFPKPSKEYDAAAVEEGMLWFPKTKLLQRFSKLGLRHPKVVEDYFSSLQVHGRPVAFAHLDSDLYDSILRSLNLVYYDMTQGGIILIDDYGSERFPGVKTACDSFFEDKPECVLVTCENQGMIQKQ